MVIGSDSIARTNELLFFDIDKNRKIDSRPHKTNNEKGLLDYFKDVNNDGDISNDEEEAYKFFIRILNTDHTDNSFNYKFNPYHTSEEFNNLKNLFIGFFKVFTKDKKFKQDAIDFGLKINLLDASKHPADDQGIDFYDRDNKSINFFLRGNQRNLEGDFCHEAGHFADLHKYPSSGDISDILVATPELPPEGSVFDNKDKKGFYIFYRAETTQNKDLKNNPELSYYTIGNAVYTVSREYNDLGRDLLYAPKEEDFRHGREETVAQLYQHEMGCFEDPTSMEAIQFIKEKLPNQYELFTTEIRERIKPDKTEFPAHQ